MMTRRNRFVEEFDERKFVYLHLQYGTLTQNSRPTVTRKKFTEMGRAQVKARMVSCSK